MGEWLKGVQGGAYRGWKEFWPVLLFHSVSSFLGIGIRLVSVNLVVMSLCDESVWQIDVKKLGLGDGVHTLHISLQYGGRRIIGTFRLNSNRILT